MKKKPLKIDISSMSGMGPAAWQRDNKPLAMHTPIRHESESRPPVRKAARGADQRRG